jgi:hypothetical protein
MNDSNISRRDWFRFGNLHSNELSEKTQSLPLYGATDQNLLLVPTPENHSRSELPQLPPIGEALLDQMQLDQLFLDIRQLGCNVQCIHRRSDRPAQPTASEDSLSQLAKLHQQLSSGQLQRVQVRYQWNGQNWIDTLERKTGNYRLVRIGHPSSISTECE